MSYRPHQTNYAQPSHVPLSESDHHGEHHTLEQHQPHYSNGGEEEDEDDDVQCAKCQAKPEDVLILTCDHNLCLECASNNLHEQQTMHQNTFQTVICEFCQSATVLDPESATELLELQHQIVEDARAVDSQRILTRGEQPAATNEFSRMPPSGTQATRNATMPPRGVNHGQQRPQQSFAATNQSYRQMRDLCKEHPEEEVNYYCFDCNTAPICSECVIHGAHQGHSVQLLRKAHPQIVKAMEELAIQVNTKIDDLALQDQRFDSRKREVGEQNHAARQYMANAFEELRKRIDQKEREMVKQCDAAAMELIAELDNSTRLIKGRMAHLGDAVDQITGRINQEDEVALAAYYADHYEDLKRTCLMDSDLPQIKELPEKINFQAKLDMTTLDQFLNMMESVQVCLENFQAVEPPSQAMQQRQTMPSAVNQARPAQSASSQVNLRRNGSNMQQQQQQQQQNLEMVHHEKLSTMGGEDHRTDISSQLGNDPSAKSVFQVAYSQKSEKQGPTSAQGAGNPLQVSVAQTMHQLQKQKQQQAQAFFSGRQQTRQQHHAMIGRVQNSGLSSMKIGQGETASDNEEPEF